MARQIGLTFGVLRSYTQQVNERAGVSDTGTQYALVGTGKDTLFLSDSANPVKAGGTLLYSDPLTDLSNFGVYNGAGAYSQQGARLAQNSSASGGILTVQCRPVTTTTVIGGHTLNPGDYAAGGVSWDPVISIGARISFDMNMTSSWGTRAVYLTWPADEVTYPWPSGGELDFIENGGVTGQYDRQRTIITNHYFDSTRPNNNGQQSIPYVHDFTSTTPWTHVEVLWKVNLFVVSFDGIEAGRFTTHVPLNDQTLRFQTAVEGGGQSPIYSGTPRNPGIMQLKNLAVYSA